jgi:hypothetical protein
MLLEIKLNKIYTPTQAKTKINTPDLYQVGFQEFETFQIVIAEYIQLKPIDNDEERNLFVKSVLKGLPLVRPNNYMKNYKDKNNTTRFDYLWAGLTDKYTDLIREARILNTIKGLTYRNNISKLTPKLENFFSSINLSEVQKSKSCLEKIPKEYSDSVIDMDLNNYTQIKID